MSHGPDEQPAAGLPGTVLDRLRSELGERAERAIRCLRTADHLIEQAGAQNRGLRLAESAAYNLREALNTVVEERDPVDGGLPAVMDAWRRYKEQQTQPDADITAARDEVDKVLDTLASDRSRASFYARKLIGHLRDRAGIDPLSGHGDPVAEYSELRDKANGAVHTDLGLPAVTRLHARTVAWFVRVFTPPDEIVEAIRALAAQPWRGREQITRLRHLVTNDHHLRLFYGELTDPAWLPHLHGERVVQLPTPGAPWPVIGLLSGLGRTSPDSVADLLDDLVRDTTTLPGDERKAARVEVLRAAVQLGQAGHDVVIRLTRTHNDLPEVRALASGAALEADPKAQVVVCAVDAVLNYYDRANPEDAYYAPLLMDRLRSGVTEDNIAERARMLAGKTRRRAGLPESRYVDLGVQALTVAMQEDAEPLLLLAHHLAHLMTEARRFGVPTTERLSWLGKVPGQVGERLVCHILADSDDVDVTEKIAHITRRLSSQSATGDDLALVTDILAHGPAAQDLAVWHTALGTPSPAPATDREEPPRDWSRVWRWAAVLPDHVLGDWQEPVAHVTSRWGPHAPDTLTGDRFTPPPLYGGSPHSVDELAALPVSQAAELIAAWRPEAEDQWLLVGPEELADALRQTVERDPVAWTADPSAVVTTLSEPLYIEQYFRGLVGRAADVVPRAGSVLAAIALARDLVAARDQHGKSPIGAGVDRADPEAAMLDLVRALADHDAATAPDLDAGTGHASVPGSDFDAHLDELWSWIPTLVQDAPRTDTDLSGPRHDALDRAISRAWGSALHAVVALAAWESRHHHAIRPEFTRTLDAVLTTPGRSGLELRAILAWRRPTLERITPGWLDIHASALFRNGEPGRRTFDLTVTYTHPTPWLYRNFATELFDAARRTVDNSTRHIAMAVLDGIDGYDPDAVIARLHATPDILSSVVADTAIVVREADRDTPRFVTALGFWSVLLDADRATVPARALHGLGRLASVTGVNDADWAELTTRALDATGGDIDQASLVADRAGATTSGPPGRDILLRLIDSTTSWQRHRIAGKAMDALRAAADQPADATVRRLRTRLIDLGYHEAADIPTDEQR